MSTRTLDEQRRCAEYLLQHGEAGPEYRGALQGLGDYVMEELLEMEAEGKE